MKNQLATNSSLTFIRANNFTTSHLKMIKSCNFEHTILKGLNPSVAIINTKNEFVFTSNGLLKNLGYEDIKNVKGKEIGDALKCVYFDRSIGCGNKNICAFCSVKLLLIKDENSLEKITVNTELLVKERDAKIEKSYEISLIPIDLEGDKFRVLTINDVSEEVRKNLLEIAFLNATNKVRLEIKELVTLGTDLVDFEKELNVSLDMLINDKILQLQECKLFYQKLSEAQDDSLTIYKEKLNSLSVFELLQASFKNRLDLKSIKLVKGLEFDVFSFYSDKSLLISTFGVLLNNAILVSNCGSEIELSATIYDNNIIFSIHNNTLMSSLEQLKVFRNFKDLGTFAAKLFVEKYLKGTVYFTSVKGLGTTFYIKLPLFFIC